MRIEWKAYAAYLFTTLVVLLPLLLPGFVLTLDLIFVPSLPLPQDITSSYPFHAMLHVLNFTIPSDVIEKIVLASIMLLACTGMHRLVRSLAERQAIDWGIYVASIFYALNPFTYSRFMAGQYAVLLGYALLPWFVQRLVLAGRQPTIKNAVLLSLVVTCIGIVSLHTLAAVGVLIILAAVVNIRRWKKYARCGAVTLGLFVLLSSYWVIPLVAGQGKTAGTIASFTSADTTAFATNGDNTLQRVGNIVRLQGFWTEGRDLYLLPQDRTFLWGLLALGIIALVILGGCTLWRTKQKMVILLGGSALGATIVASGVLGGLPLLIGLREPHKLVVLVALAYSVFLAFGVNALLARLSKKNETAYSTAALLLLILPFLFTRVMVWGFDGQLTPRHYPADWPTVRQQLAVANPDTEGRTLFVPWHQYMSFQFAGRVLANPAPTYFGPHVIASTDPELGGASGGPQDAQQVTITRLLKNHDPDLAKQLAQHNIRYVLLAKELDHRTYSYLDKQPQLVLVHDYQTLRLYKNEAWRHP